MAHRIDAAVTRVQTAGGNLEFNYKDGTKLEIGSDGSGTIYYNNGNSEKLSKTQIQNLQKAASVYLVEDKYYDNCDTTDYNNAKLALENIDFCTNEGFVDTRKLSKAVYEIEKKHPHVKFSEYQGYKDTIKALSDKIDKNGLIDVETFKQAYIKATKDTKDDRLYYFQLIAKHEKEPDKYPIYDAGDSSLELNTDMNQNVEFDSLPDKIKQCLSENVIKQINNGNMTRQELMEYLLKNKNDIGL